MKCFKFIIFLLLMGAMINCIVNIILCVPDIVLYAQKKVSPITEATVVGRDNNNVMVGYTINNLQVVTSVKDNLFLYDKYGEKVDIQYNEENPKHIVNFAIPQIIINTFLIIILYYLIAKSAIFTKEVINYNHKKWKKYNATFIESKIIERGAIYNYINKCLIKDGDKEQIVTVLSKENVLKVLLDNHIIEFVPLLVNPKVEIGKIKETNFYGDSNVYLDEVEIEKKVNIKEVGFFN